MAKSVQQVWVVLAGSSTYIVGVYWTHKEALKACKARGGDALIRKFVRTGH